MKIFPVFDESQNILSDVTGAILQGTVSDAPIGTLAALARTTASTNCYNFENISSLANPYTLPSIYKLGTPENEAEYAKHQKELQAIIDEISSVTRSTTDPYKNVLYEIRNQIEALAKRKSEEGNPVFIGFSAVKNLVDDLNRPSSLATLIDPNDPNSLYIVIDFDRFLAKTPTIVTNALNGIATKSFEPSYVAYIIHELGHIFCDLKYGYPHDPNDPNNLKDKFEHIAQMWESRYYRLRYDIKLDFGSWGGLNYLNKTFSNINIFLKNIDDLIKP